MIALQALEAFDWDLSVKAIKLKEVKNNLERKNKIMSKNVTKIYDSDELMTVNQVAGKLNVSTKTIYQWVYQKKLPYIKINGVLRFKCIDIDKLISRNYIKC